MQELVDQLRSAPSPLVDLLSLRIETVTEEEITATLPVDPAVHMHPWGAVHGGVYCAVIETLATLGAALAAIPEGKLAVGVENHTSFVRAVRGGELRARAVPLHRGRTLHLWEAQIVDERNRLVARGTVRLAIVESDGR
jgi:uncharacterized protein (TIGR00369 family)